MSSSLTRFLQIVASAKSRITEVNPVDVQHALTSGSPPLLIDVREADEHATGIIPGAHPVTRGLLEGKIEELAPAPTTWIVCYCARGNRSALAADSLRAMGYQQVSSLAGGISAWRAAGLPVDADARNRP